MIKHTTLLFCLAIFGWTLNGQSTELLIEQLKTQVNKAHYSEGQSKALSLALMGYDYIAPGDPQLQQLLYETYYSSTGEEEYYEDEGYENNFNTSDWSPDGQQLAVAVSDGTIRLYNSPFDEYKVLHEAAEQGVLDVDFSPDGKLLAFADITGHVNIINVTSGDNVNQWEHDDYIRSLEWSHDGTKLAGGGDENILYVYDTQNGNQLHAFSGHTDWIRNISWSANDRLIATASDDATAAVWSLESGALLISHSDHTDYCRDVVFAPKGDALLSCSDDLNAYLYDAASDTSPAKTLSGHEEWIMAVDWSKDGKYIATADNGGTIILHATKTGEQTFYNAVEAETSWADIDFTLDNRRFSATTINEVAIYQIGTSTPVKRIFLDGKVSTSTAIAQDALENMLNQKLPTANRIYYSPDKQKLAIINSEYQLEVLDINTGQELYRVSQHEDWIRNIAWSKDGRFIATASDDMMVGVWDANNGEMVHFLSGHEDWVRDVDFSPDGKVLLSAGDDGVLRAWDVSTGDELSTTDKIENFLMTVNWSPEQTYISAQDSEGFLSIWQANNNKLIFKSNGNTQEGSVRWTDDKNLTVISVDGDVFSWNAIGGMSMNSLPFGVTSSTGLTASAKGPYISVTGGPKSVFLEGHTSSVMGMNWSPDGNYLISYASDNMMGIWEPSKNHLIAMISTVGVFNKEVIWLADNKSFIVAGSPKITLPASSIRENIEEEGSSNFALTKEDIIAYELEKIFLNKESVSKSVLEKADADLLSAIADFYEERANSRNEGADRTKDEQKSQAFRAAAESK